MYNFKEILLSLKYYCGTYDPIKLELPDDINVIRVLYNYTNYLGELQLSLLYTTRGSKVNTNYNLGIFKNEQDISDTFIYINSFTNDNDFEYHVCYRKEQN